LETGAEAIIISRPHTHTHSQKDRQTDKEAQTSFNRHKVGNTEKCTDRQTRRHKQALTDIQNTQTEITNKEIQEDLNRHSWKRQKYIK